MVGTILLFVTEGYDDMAYLSTQVILEEAGNDVISVSPDGGALKGETSSVMTVPLEEAISQNINYAAIVLVGGNQILDNSSIKNLVSNHLTTDSIIAALDTGVDLLHSLHIDQELSIDTNIISSGKFLSLKVPENCEEFAEKLVNMIG